MKRDANLLRDLMLFIEEQPPYEITWGHSFQERFPAVDVYELSAHVEQLILSGFIDGKVIANGRQYAPKIVVESITPTGYDFLQAVRDDSAWAKVRTDVIETGKSWTLGILLEYATLKAKELLGMP